MYESPLPPPQSDSVTTAKLIERLQMLNRGHRHSAIIFDGDGTLWSGDVSEDVFLYAVKHELLHSDALESLRDIGKKHGVATQGSASRVAQAIFDAYQAGLFPEREVCEVMTWCYAGWSEADLARLARNALDTAQFQNRMNVELASILNWAQEHGVQSWVVSASPQHIVEEAAGAWGFAASHVLAARPAIRNGRILPELASAVPYGEAKCEAARKVLGQSHWLASFGDNVFDIEMLRAATLGVAVKPKPRLRERLAELPNTVVMD